MNLPGWRLYYWGCRDWENREFTSAQITYDRNAQKHYSTRQGSYGHVSGTYEVSRR